MPNLPTLRPDASVLDIYKLDMRLGQPLIRYQQQLMRGPSPLSIEERELIAAYVSSLNACQFCAGVHSAVARRFGVEPSILDRLIAGHAVENMPPKLLSVLTFVRKLTLTPARVVKSDADAVLAAGWDETALYHAVSVCALFNFFNRLVEGAGLEVAAIDVEVIASGLHSIGYEGRL